MAEDEAEVLMEIIFECTDKTTQKQLGRVIKYMLTQMKVHEKDLILSGAKETVTIDGESVERPKSVAL